MKKQTLKKCTKNFEEGEAVVKKQDLEDVIRKRKGESLFNNNYGITLIALVITVIVLLILARHFNQHALAAITAY